MKKTTSEQFCHDILKLDIKYAKAFTNTVVALSSNESAQSPVQLSESPLFHHQYSSIRDGIHGIGTTEEEQSKTMASIRSLGFAQIEHNKDQWLNVHIDATGIPKAFSKSLPDRQYIKTSNNVIRSNKPITVGYPLSLLNISRPCSHAKWSIPASIKRIRSTESATECAVAQIKELINQTDLHLSEQAILAALDSGYGCAKYLAPIYEYKNVVNIVRLRYGKKVWLPASKNTLSSSDNGAPKIYGEKYYLTDNSQMKTFHRKGIAYEVYQQSIYDLSSDDCQVLYSQTSKGRALTITLNRWNNLLMRTKDGHQMKDKPFDIVASEVTDSETGELVFKKSMFTTIHGQRKDEISTQQAFESYRHRYDIEPAIKFAKQKLMLSSYQTSDVQHFDNWLVVVMTCFWLLFAASKEADYKAKKWQQYKEINKKAAGQETASPLEKVSEEMEQIIEKQPRLTPNQTKQAAQELFLTFDTTPFLPKKSKKGVGRKKGAPGFKKPDQLVVKKTTKNDKIKLKSEKLE